MRKQGFTLMEMIVVLGLTALALTISWPAVHHNFEKTKQQIFFQSFRQEWQLAQANCKNNHEATRISYYSQERFFIFNNQHYQHEVKLPASLRLCPRKDINMHADGYVRPCSWELQNELDGHSYWMRFQMAWGGYRLEKGGLYSR